MINFVTIKHNLFRINLCKEMLLSKPYSIAERATIDWESWFNHYRIWCGWGWCCLSQRLLLQIENQKKKITEFYYEMKS